MGAKASMNFHALLDSGTDVTVIPRPIADFLGVDYDANAKTSFYGFGDKAFPCAEAKIDIVFQGKAERQLERITNVPVVVSLAEQETEPILGLAGIFDSFKTAFIQRKRIQMTRVINNQ
jgi:hypothetical protein